MKCIFAILSSVFIVLGIFVSPGESAIITLNPAVDTYVDWGENAIAHGSNGELSVGTYYTNLKNRARRILMNFDLSGVPDEVEITSAELSLYAYSDNKTGNYPVRIGGMKIPVTNSLTANDIYSTTWNTNHWGESSAIVGTGWKTWNLLETGEWDYATDLGDNSLDLYLKYANETAFHDYTLFHSMEWDGGSPNYPVLSIEYAVPIPGAALLLGSGLLCLFAVRRRVKG